MERSEITEIAEDPQQQEPIYYTAAGGVLVRNSQVLLLRRPSRDEIRLPKGHIDPGEDAQMAALRETAEESGYGGLEVQADLGIQVVRYEYKAKQYVRTERYFLLGATAELERDKPEKQFVPAWVTWEEALALLTFAAEREWVRRARRILTTRK